MVFGCNTLRVAGERFDPDLLDDQDPFEIDSQAAHLFKTSPPLPPDRLLRGRCEPRDSLPEGPMTDTSMTPEQEYDFYAQPGSQEPQGPARHRQPRLSAMVPVRFPPELLAEIRRRAEADDRSLSSWIRRAVEHELRNSA